MPDQQEQQDQQQLEQQNEDVSLQDVEKESELERTDADESGESEPVIEKTMTLRYNISADEFCDFQWLLGKKQFDKSIKRNTILGGIEIGLGVVYLISLVISSMTGNAIGGMTPYVMSLLIIGLGVYSLVYYRGMFNKRFYKMLKAQYEKTPYLKNEIVVDFYPNHVTEYFDEAPSDSYFYKMAGVRENERFFIVFLEERRCLLVPKAAITPEQVEALSAFLDEVCQNFEKPRNIQD